MSEIEQQKSNSSTNSGQRKKVNAYAKFSSMGIQMGVLIFLGVYGGQKLDEKYNFETPWMTIVGSLLGVFAGLYIVLKGVINLNKDK